MRNPSLDHAQTETEPAFDATPEELEEFSVLTGPDCAAELTPGDSGQKKPFLQRIFQPDGGIQSMRLNKNLIFFAAAALSVVLSLSYLTPVSAVAAGVVVLVSYYCIVVKTNPQADAVVYLPAIVFVSALLAMIFRTASILWAFDDLVYLRPIDDYSGFLVAFLALILYLSKSNWLGDLGGAVLALVCAFVFYGGGSVSNYASVRPTLLAVLLVNVIWLGARQFSFAATGEASKTYRVGKWLGAILFFLGLMRVLCFPAEYDVVPLLANPLKSGLGGILSWPRAVILAGVCQLFAIIMYPFGRKDRSADFEAMTICGWLILLARYTDELRFPCRWLLLLAVALFYLRGYSNGREDVLGLRKEVFYPALFLLGGFVMYLLSKEKWLTVLILLLFLPAIRNAYNAANLSDEKLRAFRWVLVLTCACAESVAMLWPGRLSLPAVLLLLAELVFPSAVVAAINLWRTDKRRLLLDNAVICALSSAIMLLTAAKLL